MDVNNNPRLARLPSKCALILFFIVHLFYPMIGFHLLRHNGVHPKSYVWLEDPPRVPSCDFVCLLMDFIEKIRICTLLFVETLLFQTLTMFPILNIEPIVKRYILRNHARLWYGFLIIYSAILTMGCIVYRGKLHPPTYPENVQKRIVQLALDAVPGWLTWTMDLAAVWLYGGYIYRVFVYYATEQEMDVDERHAHQD